jgi:hypothetical protein
MASLARAKLTREAALNPYQIKFAAKSASIAHTTTLCPPLRLGQRGVRRVIDEAE